MAQISASYSSPLSTMVSMPSKKNKSMPSCFQTWAAPTKLRSQHVPVHCRASISVANSHTFIGNRRSRFIYGKKTTVKSAEDESGEGEEDVGPDVDASKSTFFSEEDSVVEEAENLSEIELTEEVEDGEDEKEKEEESDKQWWQVMYPMAAHLSEEMFLKHRPFLDNYVFKDYDWTMDEIIEHGWSAIKFWRWNATPPNYGEFKPDQMEFATESMQLASEQGVDEPEIDASWSKRLTAKQQRERKSGPAPGATILKYSKEHFNRLAESGFPESSCFAMVTNLEAMKASRLNGLSREFSVLNTEPETEFELSEGDRIVVTEITELDMEVLNKVQSAEGAFERQFLDRIVPVLRSQHALLTSEGPLKGGRFQQLVDLANEGAALVDSYSRGAKLVGAERERTEDVVVQARVIPPFDWPPVGWQVDLDELAIIHGGRNDDFETENAGELREIPEGDEAAMEQFAMENFPRFSLFLKQYFAWVEANRERLHEEARVADPAYYPGRRKVDDLYDPEMLELPFIYPGQYYHGTVEGIHLYEGIFVDIGAVHDAWVSIKRCDWAKLRDFVSPEQRVLVEVVAKRDPWRYRFPIEVRLVEPNIDHLITLRRDYPPIFGRIGDMNMQDVALETGRPFPRISRREIDTSVPSFWLAERSPRDHPILSTVRQRHRVEQELLDIEERLGEVPQWAWERYGDIVDPYSLQLDDARHERDMVRELLEERESAEAEAEGEPEPVVRPPSRMELEIKAFQGMHLERQLARQLAVRRDVAIRQELGLPLEEFGRYGEDHEVGIDRDTRIMIEGEKNRLKKYPDTLPVDAEQSPGDWNNWACDSTILEAPKYGGIPVAYDFDNHWNV